MKKSQRKTELTLVLSTAKPSESAQLAYKKLEMIDRWFRRKKSVLEENNRNRDTSKQGSYLSIPFKPWTTAEFTSAVVYLSVKKVQGWAFHNLPS